MSDKPDDPPDENHYGAQAFCPHSEWVTHPVKRKVKMCRECLWEQPLT